MGRPRTPLLKARLEGRDLKDPQRYRGRSLPKGTGPLGNPPGWLSKEQAQLWRLFSVEVPWLDSSHRALVEIATILRARVAYERDTPVQVISALRVCLTEMGATPASASKVTVPDEGEDPDAALFRRH